MAAHEIYLKLGQAIAWNRDFRELSKPGIHPVHHVAALDDSGDNFAGTKHARPSSICETHFRAIDRHRAHVLDCQALTIQRDHLRCLGHSVGMLPNVEMLFSAALSGDIALYHFPPLSIPPPACGTSFQVNASNPSVASTHAYPVTLASENILPRPGEYEWCVQERSHLRLGLRCTDPLPRGMNNERLTTRAQSLQVIGGTRVSAVDALLAFRGVAKHIIEGRVSFSEALEQLMLSA